MDDPIFKAHETCISSFIEVVGAIATPTRDFRDQAPLILEKTVENFDKYKLWAGNVGLVNSNEHDRNLLDYRIEERSSQEAHVLKLLKTLDKTIQKALSLIQGARKPFEECPPVDLNPHSDKTASSNDDSDEQTDADDSTWEISSISDDGDDDGDSNEFNDEKDEKAAKAPDTSPSTTIITANSQEYSQLMLLAQKPNKEMPQLLETVNFVVGCLWQLPFLHVTPLNRSRLENLSNVADLHQSDDLKHIMSNFPDLGPKVAARIQKIISFHRLQIQNQSSIEDTEGLETPYPHDKFNPFHVRQISEAETTQNKHFITEFRPFICTYEDCDLSDQVFENCQEWYTHEVQTHRTKWFCNVKGHPSYAKQTGFLAHMKTNHNTTLNAGQRSILMSMFQRPIRGFEGKCNLCSAYSSNLKSHVSCHMEEIPQLALYGTNRRIGGMVELCPQSEQSLPIGFHGSPIKGPSIEGSRKKAIDHPTRDIAHHLERVTKLFKAKERGGFEVAPESRHKIASTSSLKFGPESPRGFEKGRVKEAIDRDVQWEEFCEALSSASRDGSESTVKSLLENGPFRHVKYQRCLDDALHVAAAAGHQGTVNLLLKNGADINVRGGSYHSDALQVASRAGHEGMVKLLLNNGADMNAQRGVYSNALQAASAGGHDKTVKVLLDEGADVNAQGGAHGSALQAALAEDLDPVKITIENNQVDILCANASQARSSKRENILRLLLEKGADVNARGGLYGSALRAALANKRTDAVKLLLANGANESDLKDENSGWDDAKKPT